MGITGLSGLKLCTQATLHRFIFTPPQPTAFVTPAVLAKLLIPKVEASHILAATVFAGLAIDPYFSCITA